MIRNRLLYVRPSVINATAISPWRTASLQFEIYTQGEHYMNTERAKGLRFKTHCRTITETDIVTFVNVVGLHEPFFIDMEYIRENMTGSHRSRFAPGPMIISLGMGLLATYVPGIIKQVLEGREVGPFGGMTGVQARLRGALFPGDTIHVEGEARLLPPTSRGYTLMELQHLVINQRGETIVDFTETITFLPKEAGTAA
jgi:acyl dehydratase